MTPRLRTRLLVGGLGMLLTIEARAETFSLAGGQQIDGAILTMSGTTVMIRRTTGALLSVLKSDVVSVQTTLNDGRVVIGTLVGWRDGTLTLRVADQIVELLDGAIVAAAASPDLSVPAQQAPPVAAPIGDGTLDDEFAQYLRSPGSLNPRGDKDAVIMDFLQWRKSR
jgi:hypothetical protein